MGQSHWYEHEHTRKLYSENPNYRRLFDQIEGLIPFDPEPTPEEVLLVDGCVQRECREGCLMSICKLGKGPSWRRGQVAILDCVKCLREDTRGST